jgi:hypothetical protein
VQARLDNRPLRGTLDRALFVEPPVAPRLLNAIRHQLNVLVLGASGAGKTSLLRWVEADESVSSLPMRYVDLALATDVRQALALIAEALDVRHATQFWGDVMRSTFVPPSTASDSLLRQVRILREAPPQLLLIDNPPGGGASHTLFGQLRDELWELGHRWIVAGNVTLRDELTRPPAAAFFDVQLELEPWSAELQRELIRRRLPEPRAIDVDALVGTTDGLPRSVVSLAREVVLEGGSPDDVLRRRADVSARLKRLPPSARAIAAYLATHGATSGSDPGLLGALGVSAQRARHVLRQLEQAGLVRSFVEQQTGVGRPRKLYELVEESR